MLAAPAAGVYPSKGTPVLAGERKADALVVGGGLGGFAAALALARNGLNVILTEETDWIGGQLTAQAVPPDEHPWVESFGITRSYREFRSRVRDYYRRNFPLTAEARQKPDLNPGNGNVSRLCHEPRVALAVLYEMIAQFLSGGRISVLLNYKPVSVDRIGDRIESVTLENQRENRRVTIGAPYVLDATELGDLLPLSGTEYVTGAEARGDTGEPHAPLERNPHNVQAFTCCFAMDYLEGEDHTIEKPREYAFWRSYVPDLAPQWPGRLLDWRYPHPPTLQTRVGSIDPLDRHPEKRAGSLWLYRRIADRRNFVEGAYRSDITLVNWFQNDYWLGSLIDVTPAEMAGNIDRAKQLSLSLLYWLQTEAPRLDGGIGFPGLRLRRDIVGTTDGLAKYPYVRESRRIKAELTIPEQHVSTNFRMEKTGRGRDEVTAETYTDSVGVGSYRIDLHPSTGRNSFIDLSSLPFEISLGALIPQRVENLIPACKNIGSTHITNGCYRLHPVEWNIGEAAGMLVAFCLQKRAIPRQVRATSKLLSEFQGMLQAQGIEVRWPKLLPR